MSATNRSLAKRASGFTLIELLVVVAVVAVFVSFLLAEHVGLTEEEGVNSEDEAIPSRVTHLENLVRLQEERIILLKTELDRRDGARGDSQTGESSQLWHLRRPPRPISSGTSGGTESNSGVMPRTPALVR
jgi:prepilin-type N-terminal cleavage/methylation domain-containing protein